MNPSDSTKKFLNTNFIGRKYAFEQIEKLWTIPAGTPRSMLFWGDWFTGKSEVLWHIDKHCQQIDVAYTSLQCLGGDREDKDVWLALALALDKMDAVVLVGTAIFRSKPYSAFVKYLEQALDRHPDRKLLLAIDQYEAFLNIPAATILKQLEALTLRHDRLAFLLCGSHDIGSDIGQATLDFKPSRKLWLGFFTKEETAEYCNQQPYKFDSDAIDRLYELSSGHPWLVRGVCANIISEFNWMVEEDHKVLSHITVHDVEEIAASERFYDNYRPYFTSLYNRPIVFGDVRLQEVLVELADDPDGCTVYQLARYIDRKPNQVHEVCQAAMECHAGSLIEKINKDGIETYRVVIELFRRWIFRTLK
jgi:hypothetical protein